MVKILTIAMCLMMVIPLCCNEPWWDRIRLLKKAVLIITPVESLMKRIFVTFMLLILSNSVFADVTIAC